MSSYSAFRTGGIARFFTALDSREAIAAAVEEAFLHNSKLHVIGEGTNTIFVSGTLDLFVAKMEIPGFELIDTKDESAFIRVGAGENWDATVERTLALGLSGIEAMSAIPGSAGATPIQNVGAYGQEIKDILLEVEAYDLSKGRFVTLHNEQCEFAYRASIFNTSAKNRFVITSILLKLSKLPPKIPNYAGVEAYFAERKIGSPSLLDIRYAIQKIRKMKLPDPSVIPNTGSFFKNPIVSHGFFEALKIQYPDMPFFPTDKGIKIPAGWLVEKAGFKGKKFGRVGTYDKNALVLVNLGGARSEDIFSARDEIKNNIKKKFGIELEQEAVIAK